MHIAHDVRKNIMQKLMGDEGGQVGGLCFLLLTPSVSGFDRKDK